jgi:hypothetical protein
MIGAASEIAIRGSRLSPLSNLPILRKYAAIYDGQASMCSGGGHGRLRESKAGMRPRARRAAAIFKPRMARRGRVNDALER